MTSCWCMSCSKCGRTWISATKAVPGFNKRVAKYPPYVGPCCKEKQ